MKKGFLIIFLMWAYSTILFAQPCIPPKEANCMVLKLDVVGVDINVNFHNRKPQQVVFIDGGCNLKQIYKFSSSEKLKHTVEERPHSDTILHFMLCTEGRLINEQDIPVSTHSIIKCDVNAKMNCSIEPLH